MVAAARYRRCAPRNSRPYLTDHSTPVTPWDADHRMRTWSSSHDHPDAIGRRDDGYPIPTHPLRKPLGLDAATREIAAFVAGRFENEALHIGARPAKARQYCSVLRIQDQQEVTRHIAVVAAGRRGDATECRQ